MVQDGTQNLSPPRAMHHHGKLLSPRLKMETPRPTSHGPGGDKYYVRRTWTSAGALKVRYHCLKYQGPHGPL